jgi:hypothetical protein
MATVSWLGVWLIYCLVWVWERDQTRCPSSPVAYHLLRQERPGSFALASHVTCDHQWRQTSSVHGRNSTKCCRRPRAETCSSASNSCCCQAAHGAGPSLDAASFAQQNKLMVCLVRDLHNCSPPSSNPSKTTSLVIMQVCNTLSPRCDFPHPLSPRPHPTCRSPIPSVSSFSTPYTYSLLAAAPASRFCTSPSLVESKNLREPTTAPSGSYPTTNIILSSPAT